MARVCSVPLRGLEGRRGRVRGHGAGQVNTRRLGLGWVGHLGEQED